MANSYITGMVSTSNGPVSKVSTEWSTLDLLQTFGVRWGFNRNHYSVNPGLYAVGDPGQKSDVFVTANYKLSFDLLRKNLSGTNSWILVLETHGVNVWCAAGKGTFSTTELVNRIRTVELNKVISHRKIILPQLGATGIAAHKIKAETGFIVTYGPVRAGDIRAFLDSGYKSTREMRTITFNLWDRMKLVPNDFMYGKYQLLIAFTIVFLLTGLTGSGYSIQLSMERGFIAILNIFLAYFSGKVITPAFLPYLPFRMFALKGLIAGIIMFGILTLPGFTGTTWFEMSSWLFMIVAVSSFTAMNFTGTSTYTSFSGVKKEMKLAIPLQVAFAASGLVLFIVGKIF
jgi:hypothetical protein